MTRQMNNIRRALVRRPLIGILGLCGASLVAITLLAQQDDGPISGNKSSAEFMDVGDAFPAVPDARGSLDSSNSGSESADSATSSFDDSTVEKTKRVYKLVHVGWRQFQQNLLEVWGDELTAHSEMNGRLVRVYLPAKNIERTEMVIDRSANTVTFEGSKAIVEIWSRAIQTLDAAQETDDGSIQLVGMGNAESGTVRSAAAILGLQEEENLRPVTSAVPFGAVNTTGPTRIATAIRQDPQDPNPADVFQDDEDKGIIGPVQIEILEELNAILITGKYPEDVEKVKKIIEQLVGAATTTQPIVDVYPLTNADSTALREIINDAYENYFQARSGPATITAVQQPNGILVIGQPQAHEDIKTLIDKLDKAESVEGIAEYKIYRLKHMSARDAMLRIRGYFYVTDETTNDEVQILDAGASITGPVIVIPDYRSNTLIVKANPKSLSIIDDIIKHLDVEFGDSVDGLRIIKLRNALAAELAVVIQDALNGAIQGSVPGVVPTGQFGTGNQQTQLNNQQNVPSQMRASMLQMTTIDGTPLRSSILLDVRVSADANSNSLVIRGPEKSMPLIEELVRQLDVLPDAETQIKVFTIENGDASSLLEMLQTLFGASTGIQGGGFGAQQNNLNTLPLQSASATDGSALINLRFGVDTRTNSIIASGPASDLNVVWDLLIRLDEQDINTRRAIVYRLSNAPAEDVAQAVNQWLDSRSDLIGNDPTSSSPYEVSRRTVIVVPEIVSNSLIVSAIPEYYDEVIAIINDLDRRPPMVKIKVMIAEVDLNKLSEFGIEMGIQDSLLFDRGIGSVGFPFNQQNIGNNSDALSLSTRELLAGQALSNLNIGRINDTVGYGGFVLSAGNESINILMRALENRSCVRLLSKPYIETIDNLQGFVQVGEQVPRILSVNETVGGGISTNVEDTPVGVILAVTPRVSPDGMIMMNVDATRSRLGNEEDGIPVFINNNGDVIRSPVIEQTQAQTTIMAKSGQSVVISGLIQEFDATIERGTPILSDLPVVGPLFSFKGRDKNRSELLIVLTPYLLETDEQIAATNQAEFDRMSWCLSDVADIYGPMGYGEFDPELISENTPMTFFPDKDPLGLNPVIHDENTNPNGHTNPRNTYPVNQRFQPHSQNQLRQPPNNLTEINEINGQWRDGLNNPQRGSWNDGTQYGGDVPPNLQGHNNTNRIPAAFADDPSANRIGSNERDFQPATVTPVASDPFNVPARR